MAICFSEICFSGRHDNSADGDDDEPGAAGGAAETMATIHGMQLAGMSDRVYGPRTNVSRLGKHVLSGKEDTIRGNHR